MAPADNVLEDVSDDSLGDVVDGTSWRDGACPAEDDREIDIANDAIRPLPADQVTDNWAGEPNEEEEYQGVVYLSLRELPHWSNNTPDNTGGAKYLRRRTDKAILLRRITKVLNIGEHLCLDTELCGTSYNRRDDLGPEHRPRGNLHVVAQLKVGRESQSLSHSDVTPSLEHHHCDRVAGQRVSNNQLRDDVQSHLLISDGLDHSDRNDIDKGDNQSEDEVLHRELGIPDLN